MIKFEDVKSLTYNHTKLWVPYDMNKRTKGYYFYMLNSPLESIAGILNDTTEMISNAGSIYKAYFYDYTKLPRCIQSKKVVNSGLKMAGAKKQYLQNCALIREQCNGIKAPLRIDTLAGKNFIYDLNPMTDLYNKQSKLKNLTIVNKLRTYFNTLNIFLSNKIEGYTMGGVFVDVDAYNKYTNHDVHILHNLLLLLKRSDKVIQQFNYDYKIIFYSKTGSFMFDMKNDLKKSNYSKLSRMIKKLGARFNVDKDVEETENKAVADFIVTQNLKKNAVGDIPMDTEPVNAENILDADDKVVSKVRDKMNEDLTDIDEPDTSIDDIFDSEELKAEYNDAVIVKNTGKKTQASIKRDEMLREKQKKIVVKGKTVEQITKEKTIAPIKSHKIEDPTITNENLKEMKFPEMNKEYMETTYDKDIVNTITSVNNATLPVHIVDIKIEDTSDTLNYKDTYTIIMESEDRKRHTVTVDIPKFIDDKYLYINGNKKVMQNQFFTYPVVKTGPDEVQICTNYNKIFISRVGAKFSVNSEKLRKILDDPSATISKHNGCNINVNKDYLTCLEYDELAKLYNVINIGNASFIFNAKQLEEEFDGKEHSTLDKILVGYTVENKKKVPIYYNKNDSENVDLISLMMSYASEETQAKFKGLSTGKKFVHTEAVIMSKKMPIIVLLGFFEGLDKVIRKFNDKNVQFFDKRENPHYQYIKFADGYLGYPMSDMEACMLFNGLTEIPTNAYTISDMNERNTYLDIFEYLYDSSYVAGALVNYYDFMIDPITLEVLQTLDYPTDIVSLIIYANNMLADNQYTSDMNLNQYRMRRNEVVPAILYKNIVRAYSRYRQTANNPNPVKISMDKNAVIKEIMALPTVEDYSTLSPMVEMHKDGLVSMKGANGMNLERAYKLDKRAYDDSMIGVVGISTDPGPNCGEIRQLVSEPKVINVRGFMDMTDLKDANQLNDANLVTPVEMLTPLTTTRDNSTRNAMATKQTTHVIPVEDNCPMLISTGMDEAVHYRTGDDFSVVAKDDGKVVELVPDKIMVVQYKNGTNQAIDLSSRVVKNGGGGFFLVNKLEPKVKLNQTFKKDDIIAYDPKYYRDQKVFGNRLTMGSLVKTAVISNFSTYEDSCFITKHMSQKMATNITMQKHVIVGANASVSYIVKPGQEIKIGDDLIRYETAYDDAELNKLLAGVRDDMKEDIVNLGRSKLTSSYNGVVSDIIIYPTIELDEMSDSLKKVVRAYQNNVSTAEKIIDKYDKNGNKNSCYRMGMITNKPTGVVKPDEYGKVKGYDVGRGVLIEFYITYHDEMSDGDKSAASTANKNTVGYVVPRGFEAYSQYRPYEEISAPLAPSAILQRGTPSVVTTGSVYKVLIEMKRKAYEILTGENYDEVLKQKQPWMVKNHIVTKENIEVKTLSEDDISLLESVFELGYDNDYVSSRFYEIGDVIMSMNENVDYTTMLYKFGVGESANIAIDDNTNTIKAVENIIPGDKLILREFV